MRLVGELLQERREDLGLDLDEIGAMLRIKPAYLDALEQGRTHDLPGPAYAIGFVRAYAEFLGLDAEAVLARFKAEAAGVTAPPDLALPVPLGERSLPGGALVLVALIVALCGYGIWYYLSTEDRNRPERVASVPAALQVPSSAPVLVPPPSPSPPSPVGANPAGAQGNPPPSPAPSLYGAAAGSSPAPAPPAAAPGPAAPAPAVAGVNPAPGPAGAAPAGAALAGAAAVQQAAAPTAAASSAAGTSGTASTTTAAAAGRISIRALADCWIQVRAADQSVVFSRVLRSGEVYNVPARTGLSLRTGNAGALEIAVDGKTAPSIGGLGALRRDVALDPSALAAGTAVHG